MVLGCVSEDVTITLAVVREKMVGVVFYVIGDEVLALKLRCMIRRRHDYFVWTLRNYTIHSRQSVNLMVLSSQIRV